MNCLFNTGICGHFGFGKDFFDGQTVKTKIVSDELEKQLGSDCIYKVDTYGGMKRFGSIAIQYLKMFMKCKNIMILPAQNGLKLFVPLAVLLNIFFHRKLHYIVIGGWLAEYLTEHKFLKELLKRFDGIYVETGTMKNTLEKMGFKNIVVMPNCKELKILMPEELVFDEKKPYKFCTFSRVMKEKGIEDAIDAITQINKKNDDIICMLDIYGQIDKNYEERFLELQSTFPDYISYKGIVDYNCSADVLKKYFALLFPTYYNGEGFAGTLIDAFAAGIPVIASDWKYNSELIENMKTGLVYSTSEFNTLEDSIDWMINNVDKVKEMKYNCLYESKKFRPENVINIVINELK